MLTQDFSKERVAYNIECNLQRTPEFVDTGFSGLITFNKNLKYEKEDTSVCCKIYRQLNGIYTSAN